MKTKNTRFLSLLLLTFSCILSAQNLGKREWHNHENYKQEIIENIKASPSLINKKLSFGSLKRSEKELGKRNSFPNFEIVNGVNIAWVNYGRDIGLEQNGTKYHPNLEQFGNIMDKVAESGGNVIRWWFHTNGSTSPVFDDNDSFVADNPDFFATDLKSILDLAVEKNVQIQICLWSFDMLKGGQWNVNSARNKNILVSEAHLQAYLDKCLIPLVSEVGNHPGLYAWEVFNEPEGMTTEYASHWPDFTDKVSIVDIQWSVNKIAGAIRNAQPDVKITNGALGFTSMVDNDSNGYYNNYTDERLIEKGGELNGYLDFYNIHFYNWAGTEGSPFHQNFSDQNLNKPTVVAEYYPQDTFGVNASDLGIELINRGWHGSLVWSWTDRGWGPMQPVVQNLSDHMLLSVDDLDDLDKLIIYPNPVKNKLILSNLPSNLRRIRIYDMLGSEVINNSLEVSVNRIRLDFSMFQSGVYLVCLETESSRSINTRIVKY